MEVVGLRVGPARWVKLAEVLARGLVVELVAVPLHTEHYHLLVLLKVAASAVGDGELSLELRWGGGDVVDPGLALV